MNTLAELNITLAQWSKLHIPDSPVWWVREVLVFNLTPRVVLVMTRQTNSKKLTFGELAERAPVDSPLFCRIEGREIPVTTLTYGGVIRV